MPNQYDSIRHTKCLHILCNWNRFLLIGFRILATSKDYVQINFLPQYQLVEFNKSTSSTDKSVTSHAKSLVKKTPAAYCCNRHKLSETRIACVDATEFLRAMYKYFIIPLTRHFVSTSPSGGEVKNTGCNF